MSPQALFCNAVRFFEPATAKNAPTLDAKEAGLPSNPSQIGPADLASNILVNQARTH
jgi:hypothetical protein